LKKCMNLIEKCFLSNKCMYYYDEIKIFIWILFCNIVTFSKKIQKELLTTLLNTKREHTFKPLTTVVTTPPSIIFSVDLMKVFAPKVLFFTPSSCRTLLKVPTPALRYSSATSVRPEVPAVCGAWRPFSRLLTFEQH